MDERLRRSMESISPPEPALERLRERGRRRERARRASSAAAALALTIGVLGGVFFAIRELGPASDRGISPGGPGPGTSAEKPSPLGPGQYLNEESVRMIPDAPGFEGGRVTEETWWAVDGSGRRVAHSTTESYRVGDNGTWGPGDFPAAENLSGLSTDPAVLGGQLVERSSPGGASPQPTFTPGQNPSGESGVLWRAVTALLEMPNAEPALRWALFHVAAGIPEVDVLQDVEDPVGRNAIGLRLVAEGAERILFFDPASLQPIARTEDYGDGQVWQRIVVAAGIVGSTDETPTGGEAFFPPPAGSLP